MSKIIQLDSPLCERTFLMRYGALAIRALGQQQVINEQAKTICIFFANVLARIDENVEKTCSAWEKRDYWMKADKFRLEWEWAKHYSTEVRTIINYDQWEKLPGIIEKLVPHFANTKIPQKMYLEKPWE